MAKKSKIAKNEQRQRVVARYAARRAELKEIIRRPGSTEAERAAAQRELRNGHVGCVIWLTGLPSAGKTTVATEMERELFNLGRHAYVLDGDNIRHGLERTWAFRLKIARKTSGASEK